MTIVDKRIFTTLFFSIFTAVTGVGIVVPLLPVYALNLGAGGLYIGLIFAAFSISRSAFLPIFGRASDKRGRKPFIVTGLVSYAVVSFAFIFSEQVSGLVVIRFLQGIASAMLMPVCQAYVGDITPKGSEGTVMGTFNVAMFLGLSIGPALGGFIHDTVSLDAAFASMGILSVAGFFMSLCFLPPVHQETARQQQQPTTSWWRIMADPGIIALFSIRSAYAACIGIIWGFLPVLAASELQLTSTATGLLVTLGVMVSGVMHIPMGMLADRMSRRMLVTGGSVVIIIAVLTFYWSHAFVHLLLSSLAFGFGGGIAMPAQMALAVSAGSRLNAMGSVMGVLTLAHSVGMLAGAVMAGALMDVLSLRAAFPVGSAVMAAALVAFIAFHDADATAVAPPPSDPEFL
jgi:DHA1 family multidrug resistance protein-like MFS transporter